VSAEDEVPRFMHHNQRCRAARARCMTALASAVCRGAAGSRGFEQNAHGALAARSDPEQDIVGPAHVVLDGARHAAVLNLTRVNRKIRLETSTAQQPE